MASQKLTHNQKLVLDVLEDRKTPLGAYEILDMLRDEGFRAPLQVYRILDKLMEIGMVHRIESKNAFIACSMPQCEDHSLVAFAICEKCGSVTEFDDAKIAHSIHHHVHDIGFHAKSTTLEILGLCKACNK